MNAPARLNINQLQWSHCSRFFCPFSNFSSRFTVAFKLGSSQLEMYFRRSQLRLRFLSEELKSSFLRLYSVHPVIELGLVMTAAKWCQGPHGNVERKAILIFIWPEKLQKSWQSFWAWSRFQSERFSNELLNSNALKSDFKFRTLRYVSAFQAK